MIRRVFVLLGLCAATAWGGLPEGYEVGEDTVSPDGRHALLFPTAGERPNLLVQREPFRILAEITPGAPLGATLGVGATWQGNDTVAIHQSHRWGLTGLQVFELRGSDPPRVHRILEEARKLFRADFRKRLQSRFPDEPETIVFVAEESAPAFTFAGRTLHLRLAADNKPNLAPGPHWTAFLTATWNLDTGKWDTATLTPGPIEVRAPE
jgi:hypothetical protein